MKGDRMKWLQLRRLALDKGCYPCHGGSFERADAHERISRESETLLIHWLVKGAK